MAKPGETVLRIIGRVDGKTTKHDGRYVVTYDPTLTWSNRPADRTFVLETSDDIGGALGFSDAGAAFECWRQVCPNIPLRPDRKVNRPLTAYTVQMVTA